ncbi:indoleacetamide hydrolase [Dasania marina]|uniref:indoleacetamide hydrolase n=1 Tax=Dasania marina TaxID=471499 RepID=UPI00037C12AD|nr:indoleacetamide hydrolase [Dasania marina]
MPAKTISHHLQLALLAISCSANSQTSIPSTDALTISQALNLIKSKNLSSQILVEQALHEADKNTNLNAFITLNRENAIEQSIYYDSNPSVGNNMTLRGMPIAVKDNIHVKGMPNTAGTLGLKEFYPEEDAEVIRRLKVAGAIIIGKTNMHELAYGITSNNYVFGAVANAYNAQYFAGGSSGGTATAVAVGMAIAGLGTDTGGSSRIPAALNGIVGFRPTTGRYPSEGLTSISNTRDTVGPMAHSVSDIILLDRVLSQTTAKGKVINLSDVKIGIPREYFYQDLEPDVAKATNKLLSKLAQAGVTLVEANIGNMAELNENIGFPIVIYETYQLLTAYLKQHTPDKTIHDLYNEVVSPDVKSILSLAIDGAVTKEMYLEALHTHREALRTSYKNYFQQHEVDVILFPTTPLSARPIKDSLETVSLNGKLVNTFQTYIRNTEPSSNADLPSLSIPLTLASNGLPIAIAIDGPEGDDTHLLDIGKSIEEFISKLRQTGEI